MIKIEYNVPGVVEYGHLIWKADEDFHELLGGIFSLGHITADEIERLPLLSVRSKILLSAVGASTYRHIVNNHVTEIAQLPIISSTGKFHIVIADEEDNVGEGM
ncbi:MAG: hypothetical protein NC548_38360 [Lachnospiraceae bacterium]|nr:hypothetical protein [Lachnospiraceae bacterium]